MHLKVHSGGLGGLSEEVAGAIDPAAAEKAKSSSKAIWLGVASVVGFYFLSKMKPKKRKSGGWMKEHYLYTR